MGSGQLRQNEDDSLIPWLSQCDSNERRPPACSSLLPLCPTTGDTALQSARRCNRLSTPPRRPNKRDGQTRRRDGPAPRAPRGSFAESRKQCPVDTKPSNRGGGGGGGGVVKGRQPIAASWRSAELTATPEAMDHPNHRSKNVSHSSELAVDRPRGKVAYCSWTEDNASLLRVGGGAHHGVKAQLGPVPVREAPHSSKGPRLDAARRKSPKSIGSAATTASWPSPINRWAECQPVTKATNEGRSPVSRAARGGRNNGRHDLLVSAVPQQQHASASPPSAERCADPPRQNNGSEYLDTATGGGKGVGGYSPTNALDQLSAVGKAEAQLCRCVESLYEDRIRPTAADVINRYKLFYGAPLPRDKVLSVARNSLNLCVSKQDDGSQVVLLVGGRELSYPLWVDPHDPTDRYSAAQWAALSSFLVERLRADSTTNSLPSASSPLPSSQKGPQAAMGPTAQYPPSSPTAVNQASPTANRSVGPIAGLGAALARPSPTVGSPSLQPYQFKGGRYGLATELVSKVPPFNANRFTLGEACHLVQLAINRGLLAYEQSVLQPVAACTEVTTAMLYRAHNRGSSADRLTTPPRRASLSTGKDGTPSRAADGPPLRQALTPAATLFAEAHNDLPSGCRFSSPPSMSTSLDRPVATSPQGRAQKTLRMCLDHLLQGAPQGVILAQLKKHLAERYNFAFSPEQVGARKLVDAVLGLEDICVVFSPADHSHRLVVAHKKFPIPAGARPYTSSAIKAHPCGTLSSTDPSIISFLAWKSLAEQPITGNQQSGLRAEPLANPSSAILLPSQQLALGQLAPLPSSAFPVSATDDAHLDSWLATDDAPLPSDDAQPHRPLERPPPPRRSSRRSSATLDMSLGISKWSRTPSGQSTAPSENRCRRLSDDRIS
eukprot:Selendium_serpulae@DN6454_c6_g1_i9.p1